MNQTLQTAWLKGHIDGLKSYAWWKDGVQYVGSCGTTLADAIADAEVRYAPDPEPSRNRLREAAGEQS